MWGLAGAEFGSEAVASDSVTELDEPKRLSADTDDDDEVAAAKRAMHIAFFEAWSFLRPAVMIIVL